MKKILLLTVLIGMMVMMVVYIIGLDKDPDKVLTNRMYMDWIILKKVTC